MVTEAPDATINRPAAFAWMTISALGLVGVGVFGQFVSVHTSVLFALLGKFGLSSALLFAVGPRDSLRGLGRISGGQWGRALCVMLSQAAFYFYLSRGSLLDGMLLYNTGPLFSPLLAWCFLRRSLTPASGASILLGFAGVSLVLRPTFSSTDWLLLIGLSSGFFNACSQIFLFGLAKKNESGGLFGFFALCTAGYAVAALFQAESIRSGLVDLRDPLVAGGLLAAAVCGVVNQFARARAYHRVRNPANLGPFLFVSVAVSGVIEAVTGQLELSWHLVLGGLCILLSTASVPIRVALRNRNSAS